MDANLGSLDRVYEALAAPGCGKVMEPSDGDGAGVRVFQGVTTRTDPSRTERKAAPGEGTVIRARVGRPVPSGARSAIWSCGCVFRD